MRERILDAIYKKLEEDPENENLQRQITLLNMASISTIDSFCLEVVKNYFYELENLSQNFRIADTVEIELLKQEVLDELFEKKYLEEEEDFTKLINIYTSYRDDTPLKELIIKIYDYINTSPFPLKWLNEKVEIFNIEKDLEKDFSQTIWGQILLKDLEDELIDDITVLTDISNKLQGNEELEIWKQIIDSDIKQLTVLKENLYNWDKAYQIAQNIEFQDWSRKKPKSESASEEKQIAKEIRDEVKEKYKKKKNKILITDSKESNQDIFEMYSILKKLENLIIEFDREFSNKKREKNIVDFTDIEHLALNILVKDVEKTIDENGIVYQKIIKTEVAKKYTEKFEETAIDEYQDSNLVQEYILKSVSRGNNIFMVGDVKQSIYRFRQAMPTLFLDKYEKYKKIEENTENAIGRKIQLFKNFRSRKNILDFTNTIFENVMSQQLGEVNYDKNEFLNFGAEDYKEINQDIKTEIDIIKINKEDKKQIEYKEFEEEEIDEEQNEEEKEYIEDIEIEARYVAQRIKRLIDSKFQVYDRKKESFRNITYKDIAILLRSTKDKASIFEQEIIKLGMPVFSDSNQEYLETIEIQTIMSVLKIIDNPMQDIPLVTVLRSNIGGFTDNELVEMRLSDKYDNFYYCMQKAKADVSKHLKEKIENFLNQIQEWRKAQEYLALDELIWKIYSDTGYYNYVGLMPNGNLRQANLRMLFERAKKYETSSFKGLYNFINFIEKLKNSSGDLGAAKIIGENEDVIRIMSIHKSKGLEFPVVILANANKQFNEQDIRKNPILLHQEIGIGVKYIDYSKQIKYDTLSRQALKSVIGNENISEEMRVLYVALTRAKEKLIITGIAKEYDSKIEKMNKQTKIYEKQQNKINPILIKKYKSYLDWILLVYLYEQNKSRNLFSINQIKAEDILKIKVEDIIKVTSKDVLKLLEEKNIKENLEIIKSKIEYKYESELATAIPTKTSVTQIKDIGKNSLQNEITFEKPKFLQEDKEDKITSAQKGTLIHLCMQKLNPKENYDLEKVKNLINDLLFKEIITEKEREAINPHKILEFTKSQVWKELQNAKEYYKEKPFYINVSAKEIYNEDVEEDILVQGIIDLYYINDEENLVLLDYKTDYVETGKEMDLIDKYKKQLDLYKQALESSLQRKVDKVFIYSVYLGKEIEIKYL